MVDLPKILPASIVSLDVATPSTNLADPNIGDTADSDNDLLKQPNTSFNDDHIAARLKSDETAKERLIADRGSVEFSKSTYTEYEKVAKAKDFLGAQEDPLSQEEKRKSALKQQDDRSIQERAVGDDASLVRLETHIERLLDTMSELDMQLLVASHIEERKILQQQQMLSMKLFRLELQAKYLLQQWLANGAGAHLTHDPRLTFKRLLDRLKRWPRCMRPGRRPHTDEEFDEFLAWIFEPPEISIDNDNTWS